MTRLACLCLGSYIWLLLARCVLPAQAADVHLVPTGAAKHTSNDAAAVYDRLVRPFMEKWKLPGGAVAVARGGKLVLLRAYGLADVDGKTPVAPDSLFRLASLSKPITAVTVLRLVEQHKLDLDAKAFDVLRGFEVPGDGADQRLRQITIRQLLHHTGGWDRDRSFDPMFRPKLAAETVGATPPADSTTVIRYMLRQPLDFEPGARYAYANFGYCLLGRVIEKVTGKSYEDAVRQLVLEPCGILRMRQGRTRAADRAEGEVHYYTPDGETAASVFPDVTERVPWPYGGFFLEAMDAHGGWLGSAGDLMRFVTAVDGSRKPALLSAETLKLMTARPPAPAPSDAPTYYGLGWSIRPTDKGANWSHTGSLPGTSTLLVRSADGTSWTALFNSRPKDFPNKDFHRQLDEMMWQASRETGRWPEADLFSPSDGAKPKS